MSSDLVRALAADAALQRAVGDVSSTRIVYAVVLALVAIGVVLIFLTAWLIRQTRPDPDLLAPLERMADRSWRKQDPAQKRRSLDDQRPAGATPVTREKGVPEIDEEFEQSKPSVASFDDLHAQQDAERRRTVGNDPLLTPADDVQGAPVTASWPSPRQSVQTTDEKSGDDTGEVVADVEGLASPDGE